jgi:hypothetical protein
MSRVGDLIFVLLFAFLTGLCVTQGKPFYMGMAAYFFSVMIGVLLLKILESLDRRKGSSKSVHTLRKEDDEH